jgi:hypothetical protein
VATGGKLAPQFNGCNPASELKGRATAEQIQARAGYF